MGTPIFYGYGRASTDKQTMSLDVQQHMTRLNFEYQTNSRILPPGTTYGGFFGDAATCREKHFLKRGAGGELAGLVKPGDIICVASYDRLFGSALDCFQTIAWSRERKVTLVIMDINLDTSTSAGQMFVEVMGAMKGYERREIGRRTREQKAYAKERGLPYGGRNPIGWKIKTIIPVMSKKPMKWYFPWVAERNYCNLIASLKDQHGLSMREIARKFTLEKVIKPRSGKVVSDFSDIAQYYRARKKGYPLPGGIQWKSPDFNFRLEGKSETIDLIADCA